MLFERGDELAIVGLAVEPLGRERYGFEAEAAGGVEARSVGPVGDDDGNLRRDFTGGDAGGDGLEVRAAAGEQYAKAAHT